MGDAVVLIAVPTQDGLEARDASALHSRKSDGDGVVSQDFSRRRPFADWRAQRSGNSSTELSTDPTTTSAAANPSPKSLECRFESEGSDADDGGDDRASSRGGHGSNSGGARVRKSGAVGADLGATGGAGAVCEVDGGKGSGNEAVALAPLVVGREGRHGPSCST